MEVSESESLGLSSTMIKKRLQKPNQTKTINRQNKLSGKKEDELNYDERGL